MGSEDRFNARTEELPMLRIALLGGFRVWVGPQLIPEGSWKRCKVPAHAPQARHDTLAVFVILNLVRRVCPEGLS